MIGSWRIFVGTMTVIPVTGQRCLLLWWNVLDLVCKRNRLLQTSWRCTRIGAVSEIMRQIVKTASAGCHHMTKPRSCRFLFGVLRNTSLEKCQRFTPRHYFQPLALRMIWSWQFALPTDLPLRELQRLLQERSCRPVVVDSRRCRGVVDAEELGVEGEVVAVRAYGVEDVVQVVVEGNLVQLRLHNLVLADLRVFIMGILDTLLDSVLGSPMRNSSVVEANQEEVAQDEVRDLQGSV